MVQQQRFYNVVGIFGAVASVINNTVNNLFQMGVIKEQKKMEQLQQQLAVLDNQQQSLLAQELAQTNDANQKLQILLNAVSNVQATSVQTNATNYNKWLLIGGGVAVALLITIIIVKNHHHG